jgi:hypothetical protein
VNSQLRVLPSQSKFSTTVTSQRKNYPVDLPRQLLFALLVIAASLSAANIHNLRR